MNPIQPVSIMESEWFRYKALYDKLTTESDFITNKFMTVGEWKTKYEEFLKVLRNNNDFSEQYLKERIIYATFLEMCTKSKIKDDGLLTDITEYIGILVNNTLDEIMVWSEEE